MFKFDTGFELPPLGLTNESMAGNTYYATVRPGAYVAVWSEDKHSCVCNIYNMPDTTIGRYRLMRHQEPTAFDNPLSLLAHIHHVVQQYVEQQAQLTHGGTTREDA